MNLKVLFVEDDENRRNKLIESFDQEEIAGHIISAFGAETFEKGIEMVKQTDYDIVVLDLYKGQPREESEKLGLEVLKQIQSTAFIPVIFFSGLTKDITDLKSEIVGVVNKGEGGIEGLRVELERIISSSLALIKGQIYGHIRESLRKYFWETVHQDSKVFVPGKNDVSLGYLLLRRIANSLSKDDIKTLLGDTKINADKTHPMEFYIYPVNTRDVEQGELLKNKESADIFVVLTPSCDLVLRANGQRKAEFILLAKAGLFTENADYKKLHELNQKPDKTAKEIDQQKNLLGSVKSWIGNNRGDKDRYFFLPETPFIKNSIVDFQNKIVITNEELEEKYIRLAKLDDPYAQSMISSFIRYYNRIGFPDIDADFIVNNL